MRGRSVRGDAARGGPGRRAAAAGLLLAALLGGCGSGTPSAGRASAAPSPLLAAPEPAKAPVPAVAPAGSVVELGGGRPEGMVADPVTGLVVVALRGPDRLALFDPALRTVVRTVPVPGSARHLELVPGGGAVLVPGEDTDTVSTIALPGGQVTGSVRVGRQPHDVAVLGNGDEYVADEFGGAVSLVRGGAVVTTFTGLLQPGGAKGVGDVAAVVDVRGRLVHLYRGGQQIAVLPAGAGPTHALAVGPGVLYVADTTGGALLRYDLTGAPRQTATTALPGRPYGMAYDAARGLVYITATADNLLVQYRVTATGLARTASFPTVQNAYDVAVVPATGRVVVAGESGSLLQVIDP